MKFKLSILLLFCLKSLAQTPVILFTENMGVPAVSPTTVAAHTFQNSSIFTFSGTATTVVENTPASNGYPGASGSGLIAFPNNQSEFIIQGINTVGVSNITLSFGHYKV